MLKELVDNALDACETAGVAPEIGIAVDRDDDTITITVADNGPGLPPDVLGRILDFNTRTSDKSRYRSPTRGAQGNALKTIVGIPTALGGDAPILIEACGLRHTIAPRVDTAGNVETGHTSAVIGKTTGTTVTVSLPAIAQAFAPETWVCAYALANPHALVKIGRYDRRSKHAHTPIGATVNSYHPTVAFPAEWMKWLPSDPTSPHWYDEQAIQSLIDSEIATARTAGTGDKLVRDFVREFRGLSGTVKAKAVCAEVPRAWRLSDLNGDTAVLLSAMTTATAPAKPAALGWVGPDHIRACFSHGNSIVRDRFWYYRELVLDGGIPLVVEAAVAETVTAGGLVTAINFSPAFADPLREKGLDADKVYGYGIAGLLRECAVLVRPRQAGPFFTAFVHIVCPSLTFLDRGKSQLDPSPVLQAATTKAIWRVAKTAWSEREQHRKDAAAADRRVNAAIKAWESSAPKQLDLVEAAFAVMERAWQQATSGGTRPASARTIFYQARPLIQHLTDRDLKDSYFTGTLLPRYQREVRELPGVYYEPRGNLYEPHTGKPVPLGTRDVENYTIPAWTYDKVLFIEKTGLWPVLENAHLGERYDMAIIAGSGLATVAARVLMARAEANCQLFVVHDADPAGYMIASTLAGKTARMPDHRITVKDIGLTLDDAVRMGLGTETFSRKSALAKRLTFGETERRMWKAHQPATKENPVVCERVELNAFTSVQLVDYIEAGLTHAGATAKVVPGQSWIEHEANVALKRAIRGKVETALASLVPIDMLVSRLMETVSIDARDVMPDAVRDVLNRTRASDWRSVAGSAGDRIAQTLDDVEITKALRDIVVAALETTQ